ncbi:MAG: hypothetical protein WCL29_07890, partial [Pseudomonadota bacterium]
GNTRPNSKPGVKATLTPNSPVDTATVPIAHLEEMEMAAHAYAAKQAKEKADFDLGDEFETVKITENDKQVKPTIAGEKSTVPLVPLAIIGVLAILAIGLLITLLRG